MPTEVQHKKNNSSWNVLMINTSPAHYLCWKIQEHQLGLSSDLWAGTSEGQKLCSRNNTCASATFSAKTVCFIVVQSISCVWLFVMPWTAACQVSLSFTISWCLLKLISIESVMPSNYLMLCRTLLLLPSIFSSIRVFYNELVLQIMWPKYWSFSFSISPSNEYSELMRTHCIAQGTLLRALWWSEREGNPKKRAYM